MRRLPRWKLVIESLEVRDMLTVIHIDSAWVQQAAGNPIVLNQSQATYVLETDVTVAGTAFVVAAPDVTFDLNGHTVVYGQSDLITVMNGDFEQGSENTVAGWDLVEAPAARKVPAIIGMYGEWMLELSGISNLQSIRSDPITIPSAGREYAATITPKGPYGTKVTLTVLDAVTGAPLGVGSSPNAERGFAAVAVFTPTTTNPVRLRVDVVPPPGPPAVVALDYASVVASRDYGVMATQIWSGQLPAQLQLPDILNDYRDASDFTIRNGHIVQGTSRGRASSPLYFEALPGFRVSEISSHVNGMDTHNLDANWGHDGVITSSIFEGSVDRVTNRMDIVAALYLNNFDGSVEIAGNQIDGVPQVGILVAGMPGFQGATILNNVIRQDAIVTDGYGILFAGVRNFEVADNSITPINGRGILLDGWGRIATEDGVIHDNYVDALERPNLEYGDKLTATALRLRNYGSAFRDLLITNNTFHASTGPGGVSAAQGMRISAFNDHGQMNSSNVEVRQNHFTAIVTTSDPSFRARGVSISQVHPGTGLKITGNTFESNDTSLAFGDADSWNGSAEDIWMAHNTIYRSGDGAVRPFTSIMAGDYQTKVSNIFMPFTIAQNGATPTVSYGSGAVTNLYIFWVVARYFDDVSAWSAIQAGP